MGKKIIMYAVVYTGMMVSPLLQGAVIVFNGTSCAGKSTLSDYVLKKSSMPYHYISVDEIEAALKEKSKDEDCAKSARFIAYAQAEKEALAGKVVVLDAFVPTSKELHHVQKVPVIHVLVYAPFQVLIERDVRRTEELKRNEKSQEASQGFVIECFCKLYRPCVSGETPVGYVKRASFHAAFHDYLKKTDEGTYSYVGENVRHFWHIFFSTHTGKKVGIIPRRSYDCFLDTTKKDVMEALVSFLKSKKVG